MAGVVTMLWSEHLQNYSNPSRCKRFVSSPNQPGDLRTYPLSQSLDNRGFFLRVKCLGAASSAEIKNDWSYHPLLHIPCHCREASFIPGQSMWDLWWTKWHWDRILSQYFTLLLSVSCHHCAILIDSLMVSAL